MAQRRTAQQKSTARRRGATAQARLPKERAQFKQLLAANPNYFGNLLESPFQVVKEIIGNTTYEELTCIGFNPNLNLLEATIQVKLPDGFSGDLCLAGSTEYVRFFVDYGGGWLDVGLASFNPHDIPNTNDCVDQPDKPLTYVVTLPLQPETDYCGRPVLPNVRGILSWQVTPVAGDPNWPPVWGNVLDRHIQIKPRPWRWWDLLKHIGVDLETIELPKEFEEIKFEPIPLPDPPPLSLAEVVELYKETGAQKRGQSVEPHRYGLPFLKLLAPEAGVDQQILSDTISQWGNLGIDWPAVLADLDKTKADVTYEELDCLGLEYNLERLVATFRIKLSNGYSGGLCDKGSQEYIAFWADWDDTCEWTYLGTTAVTVHDFGPALPPDGLHYSAVLPVSLDPYRQSCKEPKIARIRAVLSWAVPPSTTDPDALTTWGNRIDAHVQIKPGTKIPPGTPYISILGGIGVPQIDIMGNGMTTPWAKFALTGSDADPWDGSRECPFGGKIVVQGPPVLGSRYRVRAFNTVTLADEVATAPIRTVDLFGVGTWRYPDPDGCFTYLNTLLNMDNVLAWWTPTGDDLWEIRVEIVEPPPGTSVLATTIWHHIQLDNTGPQVKPPLGVPMGPPYLVPPTCDVTIDSGGDCKDFTVGITINGHFVARDSHFGRYTLAVLPTSMSPNTPTPNFGLVQTAPWIGDPWSLDTTGMTPCGYVVQVQAWDRTIVDSSHGLNHGNAAEVGFCLRGEA
jgi:hypothetical protein